MDLINNSTLDNYFQNFSTYGIAIINNSWYKESKQRRKTCWYCSQLSYLQPATFYSLKKHLLAEDGFTQWCILPPFSDAMTSPILYDLKILDCVLLLSASFRPCIFHSHAFPERRNVQDDLYNDKLLSFYIVHKHNNIRLDFTIMFRFS